MILAAEKISLAGPAGFRTPSDDARAETFAFIIIEHTASPTMTITHQKPASEALLVVKFSPNKKRKTHASTTAPALSQSKLHSFQYVT